MRYEEKGNQKDEVREQRDVWYAEEERSSLLIRLVKQKTQEGNANTSHSQGGNTTIRQYMNEDKCTQTLKKECTITDVLQL